MVRVSVVATGIEAGAKSKLPRHAWRGDQYGSAEADYPSAETPETEGKQQRIAILHASRGRATCG